VEGFRLLSFAFALADSGKLAAMTDAHTF